jgi:hypothetical protein
MAHIASAAGEPGLTARRHFVIKQSAEGRWCVCDREGHIECVFPTQREAIHFALFESGTRCAAVSLTPPPT